MEARLTPALEAIMRIEVDSNPLDAKSSEAARLILDCASNESWYIFTLVFVWFSVCMYHLIYGFGQSIVMVRYYFPATTSREVGVAAPAEVWFLR